MTAQIIEKVNAIQLENGPVIFLLLFSSHLTTV